VGEAGYKVVTQRRYKNLSFMFEPPESLAVNNAVSVTLKGSADWARLLIFKPAP
jgi:hypothetical protein